MLPVHPAPLKFTVKGTVPLVTLDVIAACSGVAGGVGLVFGLLNVNGAECGLSVPLVNAAVRVKFVLSLGRDTVQSREVARAFCVWQASAPSMYRL